MLSCDVPLSTGGEWYPPRCPFLPTATSFLLPTLLGHIPGLGQGLGEGSSGGEGRLGGHTMTLSQGAAPVLATRSSMPWTSLLPYSWNKRRGTGQSRCCSFHCALGLRGQPAVPLQDFGHIFPLRKERKTVI